MASSNSDPLVRFEDVQKSYDGETLVIKSLNLDMQRGEFLTMLGPSGSGKTTCLMMLAGFEPATHGEIYLNDKPINSVPPHKRGIGMVFQNYALFPHMSVGENLAFPLEVRKMGKSERDERVKKALDMVQLGPFADRRPAQLSGGQQQRVAVARALVFDPELVLMDAGVHFIINVLSSIYFNNILYSSIKPHRSVTEELAHMRERLYLHEDIYEHNTRVIASETDEQGYYVILEQSIFHPKGGGQPADRGLIGDSGVLQVKDVQGEIRHYLEGQISLGPAHCKVDQPYRQENTMLHSAGHLIGAVYEQLGWKPVKANHIKGECSVTFQLKDILNPPTPITVEKANELFTLSLSKNQPRNITFSSTEQGERRFVSFGDIANYACGGTHVSQTADIINIKINKSKIKNGKLTVFYGY